MLHIDLGGNTVERNVVRQKESSDIRVTDIVAAAYRLGSVVRVVFEMTCTVTVANFGTLDGPISVLHAPRPGESCCCLWHRLEPSTWIVAGIGITNGGMVIALSQEDKGRFRNCAGNDVEVVERMKTLAVAHSEMIVVGCSSNFVGASPTDMRPLSLCIHLLYLRPAWFLGLILLSGLSGCGPAASDHATSLEPRASLGTPSKSQSVSQHSHSLVSRNYQSPPSASYAPLAAETGASHSTAPAAQEEPEQLVLPTWIAQALKAPEVSVRLQALDMWASQGAEASLDPLVVALDDENDDVRAKAMAIIEQHWAVEDEAGVGSGR